MGDLEDKTEKWWGLILEGLERDEAGNPGRSNASRSAASATSQESTQLMYHSVLLPRGLLFRKWPLYRSNVSL